MQGAFRIAKMSGRPVGDYGGNFCEDGQRDSLGTVAAQVESDGGMDPFAT